MAKLSLNDITTLANTSSAKQALNENFAAIEAALEDTLSRSGATPNQMEADIDLNSNDLLNVGSVDAAEYLINGVPLSQEVAYANKLYDLFAGDGSRTNFGPLQVAPGSLGNLAVSVDGVVQRPGEDFSYSGTELIFTDPPPGDGIERNILVRYDEAVQLGYVDTNTMIYTPPSTGVAGPLENFLDSLWSPLQTAGAALIRFIQVGAGAIARTLLAKVQERVSAADFGAVGDGVTDDTAALSALILTGKKRVIIGPGTYIISAALPVYPGQHVQGEGYPVIKMKDGLGASIPGTLLNLNFPGSFANVSYDGIIFDSNRDNNIDHGVPDGAGNQSSAWVGQHVATAIFANVDGLRLTNCTFRNSWGNGVLQNNCTNFYVENCRFENHRRVGYAIQNDTSQYGRVIGNYADNCVVGIMVIDGGHDISIMGNTVTNCSDRNRFPAIGYSGTYPNVWPSTGGFINSGAGGYVSPTQPGDGSGIEVTGSTSTPLLAAYNLAISGNTADSCWVGIRVEGQNFRVSVTGNTVRNSEGPGIFLFSSQRTSVTGNTCEANAVGIQSLQGPGVPFPQRPRFNVYSGNICHGNTQYGIQLGGEANSVVVGNELVANGAGAGIQGGISMVVAQGINCDLNSIIGNQISNNNWLGIGFDGATHTGNTIAANTFNGNTLANVHTPVGSYPWNTNRVSANVGFATAGFGTASIGVGNTSVVVNHNLNITPDGGRLSITPAQDTGGKRYWVDTITSTQFTIHIDSASGATQTFHWQCAEDV